MEYLQRAANFLQGASVQPGQRISSKVGGINNETSEQPIAQNRLFNFDNNKSITSFINAGHVSTPSPLTNLTRVYLSQMRGVSLKTQTRLAVPVKRSFCKRCDTLLDQGASCVHEVRNASRGRSKPWADVLVIRCLVCGTEKRFPQTDRRSRKLSDRQAQLKQQENSGSQQDQTEAS